MQCLNLMTLYVYKHLRKKKLSQMAHLFHLKIERMNIESFIIACKLGHLALQLLCSLQRRLLNAHRQNVK